MSNNSADESIEALIYGEGLDISSLNAKIVAGV